MAASLARRDIYIYIFYIHTIYKHIGLSIDPDWVEGGGLGLPHGHMGSPGHMGSSSGSSFGIVGVIVRPSLA